MITDHTEQLRMKMTREAELIRKVQIQAEGAKRDVTTLEPRLEKCVQGLNSIAKCFSQINSLDQQMRIDAEKTTHIIDNVESNLHMIEAKMANQTQQFNI